LHLQRRRNENVARRREQAVRIDEPDVRKVLEPLLADEDLARFVL